MPRAPFVDHYEILQLSPNATSEMIERVYRILAKRYHPDNQETGDAVKFGEVQRAFEVLYEPSSRAAYDATYEQDRTVTWQVFRQEGAGDHRHDDRRLFHAILSLLYIARRRDPENGGLGSVGLEKMLGCPQEHLLFPLWYLKQKGWVERLENGYLAITADGVDKLSHDDIALPANRLISESSVQDVGPARRGEPILLDEPHPPTTPETH